MMRRIMLVVTVALVMAALVLAMAMPVFAAASDNASCIGEAFSEAPPGSKGGEVSEAATEEETGFLGESVSTFAPQKENCPPLS